MDKRIIVTIPQDLADLIESQKNIRSTSSCVREALVMFFNSQNAVLGHSALLKRIEKLEGKGGKDSQLAVTPGIAAVDHYKKMWRKGDRVELREYYERETKQNIFHVYVNGSIVRQTWDDPTASDSPETFGCNEEQLARFESQGVTITRLDSSAAGHTSPAPAPKHRPTGDAPKKFYLYWTDKYGDEYGEVTNGKRVEYGKYHEGDIPEGAVIVSDTREEDKAEHDAVFGDLDND